jgi:hypothetical protein
VVTVTESSATRTLLRSLIQILLSLPETYQVMMADPA